MAPDVTVSIVHASQPELTLDCLDSLVAGDPARRTSLEIVVLDNAAEDGLAAAVRQRFEDVRLIEHDRRAGFGANHNAVIRQTSGRYVFVLNPDTRVMPGAIDTLAGYLDEHPQVAIVGPLIRDFNGRREASALRLMSVRVQLVWALTLGKLGALQATRATEPQRVGAVSGSAMVARRSVLERVGGFDEEYFMYVEEADLAKRLDRIGYERHYVPTAEVLHHGLASTLHVPEHRINEFWRSLEIYLRRYHSPLEARILRWLTGLGYAFGLAAAAVGGRLPEGMRPAGTRSWDPALYRLHVRNALHGVRGPTLGTLAADWNRAHALDSAGEGVAP